jgi:outer membrane protein assembly factor BamB
MILFSRRNIVKFKKLFILVVAIMLSALLSGCSASAMRSNSWPGLSADDEKAYLANGSLVYAINTNNGSVAWQYPADKADTKEAYFADPVLTEDGQILLASAGTGHSLVSVNSATGAMNWSFTDSDGIWIASPVVVGETIYAPNTDGKLYTFNLQGNFIGAKHIGGPLWAQPISDGEFLYINSLDHHTYALNIRTEEVVWSTELSGAAPGSPALGEDGMLYSGSFGSKLQAVNSATQSVKWTLDTEGWIWDAPALNGETLFVGDLEGNLYAVNAPDGSLLWGPVQPDGTILGTPLVTDEFVVIGTESGTAYAYDRTGATLWQQAIGGQLYSAPVQSGDLILFAPTETDSMLVALDAEGRQVWQFTPEK